MTPKSMTIPPTLAAEVVREARRRGWDADAYLAHLIQIGMRVMAAMRVNVGSKSR